MARFVKGDVVVVPFPFADLSEAKRRPALVVADLAGDDLILCQITSQYVKDSYSILLDEEHFEFGRLNRMRISVQIGSSLPTQKSYSIRLDILRKKKSRK
jgi:hypothetical protein